MTSSPVRDIITWITACSSSRPEDGSVPACTDTELADAIRQAGRLLAQVEAARMALLQIAEQRKALAPTGLGTQEWLAADTKCGAKQAADDMRLARGLKEFAQLGEVFASGEATRSQAAAAVSQIDKQAVGLSAQQRQAVETIVAAQVAVTEPRDMRRLTQAAVDAVTAEERLQASREEMLVKRREKAYRNKFLSFIDDGDGSMILKGSLPYAEAEGLRAQLQAFADAPCPGRENLELSRGQRMADALVSLSASVANAGTAPQAGVDRPTVFVTLPGDVLLESLGTHASASGMPTLVDGTEISWGEARRLASDADIIPVVLGKDGAIVEMGRAQRLVGKDLRRLLTLRDGGCAFPGCGVTASACHAHHIEPWWAGGETSPDNTVLLCSHHHQTVEPERSPRDSRQRWEVRINLDDLRPEFLPPACVDPRRKPRRNTRHVPVTLAA